MWQRKLVLLSEWSVFPVRHTPLLLLLVLLFDAVEQTAGDEGHGHEQDDGRAHDRCQHSHAETVGLVGRQRWSARGKEKRKKRGRVLTDLSTLFPCNALNVLDDSIHHAAEIYTQQFLIGLIISSDESRRE